MGTKIVDQFSLLHFAVGIVVYFWNVPLLLWFVLHTMFELIENTPQGIYFINHYIYFWPGGKPKADTAINTIGDTLFAMLGWIVAYYTTQLANSLKLY